MGSGGLAWVVKRLLRGFLLYRHRVAQVVVDV